MEMRHSDNDGSDIFWPGYVDAVTNLVLNLLFLLTIMTVAVFMFALELGRASKGGADKALVASSKQGSAAISKTAIDPVKENIELKLEIQRLNRELERRLPHTVQPVQPGGLVKTVEVTPKVSKPVIGIDKTVVSDLEVIVRFTDEAVALTPAEHDHVVESLKPILSMGKARVYVEVPAGFTEARRIGFYRAMAVRNVLMEMKMPKDRIDVSVHEGNSNAKATVVRVRPR